MGLSSNASQIDARGKLVKFPAPQSALPQRAGRSRRYWLLGGAAAVLIAVGATIFMLWSLGRNHGVQYSTAPVGRGAIVRTVTATGTVNPVLTVIVGTYVSGVIQGLYCDYNTHVRAGQVCAKIDPRPYQATFDQYSGQLARDQATLAKDRTDLDRYQKLAAENSIARQQAEDQGFLVNQDEATVKLDQALLDGAKLNLYYTDIVSPVDGTVVSRSVTGGQTVAATFQTPTLFLIATDLKQMEVDTNTSEGDMAGIKVGDTASFTVDAFPQRLFTGTVSQVRLSPQTVQNVVTYDVVVGVDNSDLALAPGMTASTQIVTDRRDDVLRVPNLALRYTPSNPPSPAPANTKDRVYVLRDGAPVEVAVVTGLDDGNFAEIVKGELKPGDSVITGERNEPGSAQAGSPTARF